MSRKVETFGSLGTGDREPILGILKNLLRLRGNDSLGRKVTVVGVWGREEKKKRKALRRWMKSCVRKLVGIWRCCHLDCDGGVGVRIMIPPIFNNPS